MPLDAGRFGAAVAEICTNRTAVGYTVTVGLLFGSFVAYLSSSQQILQAQYGLGRLFPLYFAILALSIGCASLFNARLVVRLGMRRLCRWALLILVALSFVFLSVALAASGQPGLWMLMLYFIGIFFCIGVLFGNVNALAMEPLGHIACVGAAVVGSISTLISVPLGMYIGSVYDGTVLSLVAGFTLLLAAALAVMEWTEWKARSAD